LRREAPAIRHAIVVRRASRSAPCAATRHPSLDSRVQRDFSGIARAFAYCATCGGSCVSRQRLHESVRIAGQVNPSQSSSHARHDASVAIHHDAHRVAAKSFHASHSAPLFSSGDAYNACSSLPVTPNAERRRRAKRLAVCRKSEIADVGASIDDAEPRH